MKNSIKILIMTIAGVLAITVFGVGQMFFDTQKCSLTRWLGKLRFSKGHHHFDIHAALGKGDTYPIVIIGSGPAGLAAATYGGRNHYKTLIIEGHEPGGLLTKTSYVENMPGFKAVLGKDLIQNMKEQATHFGAEFLDDIVETIDFSSWPYKISTDNGKTIYALTVIIATGASPKVLGIPGEKDYWGRGVTTCAICDAPFYKGKNVVVIGGGDSAVEEALQLAPVVTKVTILVRKSSMRAAAASQELLKGYSNISVRYNVEPKKIIGNDKHVTGIELFDNKKNETVTEPIDGVFLAIGHKPNTALFVGKVDLDDNEYIVITDRSQKTSIPGVFAAGDVEDHRYRQAGVAAGHGITAALDAGAFLTEIGFNEKIAAQLHSTHAATVKVVSSAVRKVHSVDEFDLEIRDGHKLVFVDFFAPHCPSCMQMLPHFEEVATSFRELATFMEVDIDTVPDLAKKYMVEKIPCLLIFKEGKMVGRYVTALTKRQLQETVAELVKESPAPQE